MRTTGIQPHEQRLLAEMSLSQMMIFSILQKFTNHRITLFSARKQRLETLPLYMQKTWGMQLSLWKM